MDVVINALEQGLLFALVAMGVYITYKILDFPDLSVDGTFPLGASISAALLINGVNPWISILIATIGGAIAGSITGFLHVKLKISNLMSGILVMMGLYSVNLRIMGRPNLSLLNKETIFSKFQSLNLPTHYDTVLLGFILSVFILEDKSWIFIDSSRR